jgi:undecaprenyl-diphosphatase
MLLFDLIIHTGTVIAIFIVFRRIIVIYLRNLFSAFGSDKSLTEKYRRNASFRITILAVITTFVTASLGFIFEDFFTRTFASMTLLGIMWLVNGTFLLITDKKRGRRGLRKFGITAAVIIGIAQAIAIVPSISRSGATICAAILLGIRRRWAVQYSFLIAIPVIVGATAAELLKNARQISLETLPTSPLVLGFIIATVSGVFALKILIKLTQKAKLKIFAFYCFILACLVLIYCLQ